jgi:hypothetical protein
MAEALSVIYRGFAVVPLALQLLDTAQKLHEFWHSFEDAGSDVERIKDHLVTLHAVAATVAEICQQETQIKCTEVVLSSLLAWGTRTKRSTHLMKNIGRDRQAGQWDKGWTSLRSTLKGKTIYKIGRQSSEDVLMLLLELQPVNMFLSRAVSPGHALICVQKLHSRILVTSVVVLTLFSSVATHSSSSSATSFLIRPP